MFKNFFLLGALTLFGIIVLPSSTLAAKPISQNFPSSQIVYLPLKHHKAYVLSNDSFYTTKFPGIAGIPWQNIGTKLPLEKNRSYRIMYTSAIGVQLKGYTYFVLLTGAADQNVVSARYDKIEIWRIQEKTKTIERITSWDAYTVDSHSTNNYFYPINLVKYNQALYLLQSNGALLRSTDGGNWNELTFSGGILSSFSDLTANISGLYLTVDRNYNPLAAIYKSTNDKTWVKLPDMPITNNELISSVTVIQNTVYVTTSNVLVYPYQFQLWKYDGSNWVSLLISNNTGMFVDHRNETLYLNQYNFDNGKSTISISINEGNTFTQLFKTTQNITGDRLIKNLAKPAFIISSQINGGSSYLLRVK